MWRLCSVSTMPERTSPPSRFGCAVRLTSLSSSASNTDHGGSHAEEVPRPPHRLGARGSRRARPRRQGSRSQAAVRPRPAQGRRLRRGARLDRREDRRRLRRERGEGGPRAAGDGRGSPSVAAGASSPKRRVTSSGRPTHGPRRFGWCWTTSPRTPRRPSTRSSSRSGRGAWRAGSSSCTRRCTGRG